MIIPVTDPDDPRVDAYRDIRERDLVGRQHRFVAEGKVVLEKLVGSANHELLSLLIAAHRVPSLASMLAALPDSVPVFAAEQPVMDRIAGFPLHRGILGIGRRKEEPAAAKLLAPLGPEALVVALSGIANHDNMGGIFRNAAAFGVDAVILDSSCCDPLYRKAIRVSVGATLLVPFAKLGPGDDLPSLLGDGGFNLIALSPSGEWELSDISPAPKTAILLGAEGPGLPPHLLARTRTVRIAMSRGFDSLNVATTSGIVLHHLARNRRS